MEIINIFLFAILLANYRKKLITNKIYSNHVSRIWYSILCRYDCPKCYIFIIILEIYILYFKEDCGYLIYIYIYYFLLLNK